MLMESIYNALALPVLPTVSGAPTSTKTATTFFNENCFVLADESFGASDVCLPGFFSTRF